MFDFFPNTSQDTPSTILQIVYDRLYKDKRDGLIAAPFFNINTKKIVYLPYNFVFSITGSNGMASGNTIAEATFQAMCEIYERYAASQVYNENLTPPTISKDYLSKFPEEYNIINEIEKFGFEVLVKDFSLNKKIPVLGLLILDKNEHKYLLNIGSDTNFKIALSRTLTEIYQGLDNDSFKKKFLEIPNKKITPYFFNKKNIDEKESNFKDFVVNGTGYFPPSLFKNDFSYSFDSDIFKPKNSYEEEVKYLFSIAKGLNFSIYIRDVSFLGFPSVYIYVPNISILGKKAINMKFDESSFATDEIEKLLYPFEDLINDKNKIKKILSVLENMGALNQRNENTSVKGLFRLEFRKDSIWSEIKINFFLVLLYFLNNDYKNAIKFLDRYIIQNNLSDDKYFKYVLKYFQLLKSNEPVNEIPNDIKIDFITPATLFKNIGYPKCPNCTLCDLRNDCLTRINIENVIRINNKTKDVTINQYQFEIFT